jgi:uncharacterized membrane protein
MVEEKITADRLIAFSDSVIVTVMVLELKAPAQPAFSAGLCGLQPSVMRVRDS